MKNYIRRSPHVNLLKRNAKLESEKIYLIQSETAVRSHYFGHRREVTYAKKMFRKHFSGILEIVSEYYTSQGFALFVKIRNIKQVEEEWNRRGKRKMELHSVISEVIRYSISAISKYRNKLSGRKGSLVRENFRTFVVRSYVVMKDLMKEMCSGKLFLSGQKDGFRRSGGFGGEYVEWVGDFTSFVLREMVNSTLHSIPINYFAIPSPKPPLSQ